jgi:ribosomal protein S18 acetylase RimI-like enzyme
MIILRKAKAKDISSIQSIADSTWYNTYADYLSAEQIEYMLQKMYNEGTLMAQLQEGQIFLIASNNERDIGFAGFSRSEHNAGTYKLHKLYVLPEMHGLGVGKLLINAVLKSIKELGGKYVELNVNRNNKAAAFYKSAGFEIKDSVDLDIGEGYFMNDYVMVKAITEEAT